MPKGRNGHDCENRSAPSLFFFFFLPRAENMAMVPLGNATYFLYSKRRHPCWRGRREAAMFAGSKGLKPSTKQRRGAEGHYEGNEEQHSVDGVVCGKADTEGNGRAPSRSRLPGGCDASAAALAGSPCRHKFGPSAPWILPGVRICSCLCASVRSCVTCSRCCGSAVFTAFRPLFC